MNAFINLLKNRTIQNHLIYAFGGLFLALLLIFLILQIYTRHGRELTTPSFSGLSIEDAQELAHKHSLHFLINDSTFTPGKEPGAIIDQNPSAGTNVKVNRTIFLTINAKKPVKIKMPNVVGVSLRQAEAILQREGLHLARKKYVPDMARDYVLRQQYKGKDIPTGTKVIKGSGIDLVLGTGNRKQ